MELYVQCFNRDPRQSGVPTVFRFTVKDSQTAWERLAWLAEEIVDQSKWIVTANLKDDRI